MTDRHDAPDTDQTDRGAKHQEEKEAVKADSMAHPSAPTVYQVVSASGEEEMERPLTSLWWSGVAAGLGISVSLYLMAVLRMELQGAPGALVIEKLGYCVGFVIVVLGRFQLFTENTITPVLPVLRSRRLSDLGRLVRLWIVVFCANLVGTFIAVALPSFLPVTSDAHMASLLEIAMAFKERTPLEAFSSGAPAGFLIAAMVWMLPSSKGFEFWTIVAATYPIAIGEASHVIIGSTEMFALLLDGSASIRDVVVQVGMTGLGNVIGGTGLFALLAYGQVSEEL